NSKGQIVRLYRGPAVEATGNEAVQYLYAYNDLGERELEALDVDQSGTINLDMFDRVTRTTRTIASRGEGPVIRITKETFPTDWSATPVVIEVTDTLIGGRETWRSKTGLPVTHAETVIDQT